MLTLLYVLAKTTVMLWNLMTENSSDKYSESELAKLK